MSQGEKTGKRKMRAKTIINNTTVTVTTPLVFNDFLFLCYVKGPVLRTFCLMKLSKALPDQVVTSAFVSVGATKCCFCEVVQATQFLRARFTLQFLCIMIRKSLYLDLVDIDLPVSLLLSINRAGTGYDALEGVKK